MREIEFAEQLIVSGGQLPTPEEGPLVMPTVHADQPTWRGFAELGLLDRYLSADLSGSEYQSEDSPNIPQESWDMVQFTMLTELQNTLDAHNDQMSAEHDEIKDAIDAVAAELNVTPEELVESLESLREAIETGNIEAADAAEMSTWLAIIGLLVRD